MSENGAPPAPPVVEVPAVLVGSLYVEFLGQGRELVPRVLGHIPDNAAAACADILEKIARNMRARGSRIIRPVP